MKFIAQKTEDGVVKRKISFYCETLKVSRQAFYDYLNNKNKPWKYEHLAQLIKNILSEDDCNYTYGRGRMYAALKLKYPDEKIPSERTLYRIMERIGADHPKRRKPTGITKGDT